MGKAAAAKTAALKGKGHKNVVTRTKLHFYKPKTATSLRKPKYARSSGTGEAKQDKYAIIKFPLTTESAMKKIEDNNTLVFIVATTANKRNIKDAVKAMYEIQCEKVNTLIRCVTCRPADAVRRRCRRPAASAAAVSPSSPPRCRRAGTAATAIAAIAAAHTGRHSGACAGGIVGRACVGCQHQREQRQHSRPRTHGGDRLRPAEARARPRCCHARAPADPLRPRHSSLRVSNLSLTPPSSRSPLHSPDGQKKAYVRLTQDYDALDVANRIGII
jgi:large subunit ribosomal protein L23Ae